MAFGEWDCLEETDGVPVRMVEADAFTVATDGELMMDDLFVETVKNQII